MSQFMFFPGNLVSVTVILDLGGSESSKFLIWLEANEFNSKKLSIIMIIEPAIVAWIHLSALVIALGCNVTYLLFQ